MSDDTNTDDTTPDDPDLTEAENNEDDLAPEEEELKGWLPEAEPTDGPAPAP